jgi:hypothetical protein
LINFLDYPLSKLDNLFSYTHTVPPKRINSGVNILDFAINLKENELGWYMSTAASNSIGGLPSGFNGAFVALITSYNPSGKYRTILLFPYAKNQILYNTNHSDGYGQVIKWSGWFSLNMTSVQ